MDSILIEKGITERAEKYARIIKAVPAFNVLKEEEEIFDVLRAMRTEDFVKGEVIFSQGEVGNEFFIIEEGQVEVKKKFDINDEDETPRLLQILSSCDFFGEVAIINDEPRSATITVSSEKCTCLVLERATFESIRMDLTKFDERQQERIAEAVEKNPTFRAFPIEHRTRLGKAMTIKQFLPGNYICEEGTPGNIFYIVLRGVCRVTKKRGKDLKDEELAILRKNDYFGEVAILNGSSKGNNMRTANVVAATHVTCLSLTRSKFLAMMPSAFQTILLNHAAMKRLTTADTGGEFAKKKVQNRPALMELARYSTATFRGLAMHVYAGLKSSTYASLYELLLSNPRISQEVGLGQVSELLIYGRRDRLGGLHTIRNSVLQALQCPWRKRTDEQVKLLHLLVEKNAISERSFAGWPSFQVADLARRLEIVQYKSLDTIYQAGEQGDCGFMVLRGMVRGLAMDEDDKNDQVPFAIQHQLKTQRSQDSKSSETDVPPRPQQLPKSKLMRQHSAGYSAPSNLKKVIDIAPGECFGCKALEGNLVRALTMVAMTPVDLVIVPGEAMRKIRFHEECTIPTDDKVSFLQSLQLFSKVDLFKLYRIALKLKAQDIAKEEKIFEQNSLYDGLAFIFSGSVDLVSVAKSKKRSANIKSVGKKDFLRLATLSKGQYLGEVSLVNTKLAKYNPKEKELVTAIAGINLTLLILPSSSFDLLDQSVVETIVQEHEGHSLFLQERLHQIKKALKNMHKQKSNRELSSKNTKNLFENQYIKGYDEGSVGNGQPLHSAASIQQERGRGSEVSICSLSSDGSFKRQKAGSISSLDFSDVDDNRSQKGNSRFPSRIRANTDCSMLPSSKNNSYISSTLQSKDCSSVPPSKNPTRSNSRSTSRNLEFSELQSQFVGKIVSYSNIQPTRLPVQTPRSGSRPTQTPSSGSRKRIEPNSNLLPQIETTTQRMYFNKGTGESKPHKSSLKESTVSNKVHFSSDQKQLKVEGTAEQRLLAGSIAECESKESRKYSTDSAYSEQKYQKSSLNHSLCSSTSYIDKPLHWISADHRGGIYSNSNSSPSCNQSSLDKGQTVTVDYIKQLIEGTKSNQKSKVLPTVQPRNDLLCASLSSIPSISHGTRNGQHKSNESHVNINFAFPLFGFPSKK